MLLECWCSPRCPPLHTGPPVSEGAFCTKICCGSAIRELMGMDFERSRGDHEKCAARAAGATGFRTLALGDSSMAGTGMLMSVSPHVIAGVHTIGLPIRQSIRVGIQIL